MKKGNFTSLMLLSGALVLPAYAEKVQLEQLPADLQEKIRAQTGGNRVEDIDRETKNGRTVYEVAFKENGQHREVRIEHNAAATPAASTTSSSAVDSRKIPYEQLPDNVKRVADAQLQGAQVNDVDRQVKNGRTTYEIGYKRNDGPQQELLLSSDGQILSEGSSVAAGSSSTTVNEPYRNYRGVIPGQRPSPSQPAASVAVNARAMEYNQLPANIRSVAEDRLSEGDVSKVHRFIQNGQVSYQIEFRKEDGRTQQLLVSEDGRVLRDQFISASSVGAPGSIQWGGDSSENLAGTDSSYDFVTSPVNLVNSENIRPAQLPDAVARTVRGYTTDTNIREVHRGTWRERDVYQVSYMDRNNQLVRLQLDGNGQVIYDPRGANNTGSATGNLINNIGRALFDNDNN